LRVMVIFSPLATRSSKPPGRTAAFVPKDSPFQAPPAPFRGCDL
jgi:hypothetical protein